MLLLQGSQAAFLQLYNEISSLFERREKFLCFGLMSEKRTLKWLTVPCLFFLTRVVRWIISKNSCLQSLRQDQNAIFLWNCSKCFVKTSQWSSREIYSLEIGSIQSFYWNWKKGSPGKEVRMRVNASPSIQHS